MSFASADIQLDDFKQGECAKLEQTCDTCTYVNLTKVSKTGANATSWNINQPMTKVGVDYNYSFCNTNSLGNYIYTVVGDKDGEIDTEKGYFGITPSGNSGSENTVFFIFIITLIYVFTFVSFFYARNVPLTVLGGGAMMSLGVYIVREGIIIFRDILTNYVAYITIAAGAILAIWALLEQFEVL